jgi:hypothetical protein
MRKDERKGGTKMRLTKIAAIVLAAGVAAPWTAALANGKSGTHGAVTKTSTVASHCVAGSSTATFTDKFGSGTAAFRTRGACTSFVAKDKSLSAFSVTATTSFTPKSALPPTTTSLKLDGNSLAARAACPLTHNFTVAFTNNSVMVNGTAVKVLGQTVSVNQLSTSATTVLAGTHTFANHGGCVSFFAKNRHLFVFTLK